MCHDAREEEAAVKFMELDGFGEHRPSDMLAHHTMLRPTLNDSSRLTAMFRERALIQLPGSLWQHRH